VGESQEPGLLVTGLRARGDAECCAAPIPFCEDLALIQLVCRISEGKSEREAVRCPKRYLARSLFRLLEAMPKT
jgi:hypothetical protein